MPEKKVTTTKFHREPAGFAASNPSLRDAPIKPPSVRDLAQILEKGSKFQQRDSTRVLEACLASSKRGDSQEPAMIPRQGGETAMG